jgi:glycosyltransferase involved in cell wall biosynthesis
MRPLLIIPAYNEAESLAAVVAEIHARAPGLELLIVDDGSTDATATILPRLGVRWVRLAQRLGTGAAVRTGLRYAVSRGFDTVVRLDGDGQHPAHAIERLLAPIVSGTADAVVGSRYADGMPGHRGVVRRASQSLLGRVLTVLTAQQVTDPTSGLWAFGPNALRVLVDHHPSGYPEPELLLFLGRNSLRVTEVGVEMRDRQAGRSSLTPPRTGAALARLLLLLIVVPLRAAVGTHRD